MKRKQVAVALLTGALLLQGTGLMGSALVMPSVYAQEANFTITGGVANLGDGSASIRIRGNSGQTLTGKKFMVYPLFYAENAKHGESINYTFHPTTKDVMIKVVKEELAKQGKEVNIPTEYMVVDYIQSLNHHKTEGATIIQTLESHYSEFRYFVEAVRTELKNSGVEGSVVEVKDTKEDNSFTIKGLTYGYYLVDEISEVETTHAASSLCMVDTANPGAEIAIKSDYPNVTKKIQEDDEHPGITHPERWNDIGDYEIGQTVPYRFDSNIPNISGYDSYYYAWHDKMDEALTFHPESVAIFIAGEDGKTYEVKQEEFQVEIKPEGEETFQVSIKDIKAILDREFYNGENKVEHSYGQKVTVKYNATLNEKAAPRTGRAGFENDVRLEFSNDPDGDGNGKTGYTPWDTVVAFTFRFNITKTNDHEVKLEDAHFRLYSDPECKEEVYVKPFESGDGYVVMNRDLFGGTDHTGGIAPKETVEMVSPENGEFVIYGLDSGIYYLKETEAPAGYRLLKKPIILTITATYQEDRDDYVKGNGATDVTLKTLEAKAQIDSFYAGLETSNQMDLETEVENGSMNLTVVNKVGSKLPITGTPMLMLMGVGGMTLMGGSYLVSKKKKEEHHE